MKIASSRGVPWAVKRDFGRAGALGVLLGLFGAMFSARAAESDVFGRKEQSGSALIGILYDFKQTQKRQPTGIKEGEYIRVVEEFLAKDWSESVLNRYFRATRPLYTTQIFIPLMSAGQAPKAFEMEKVIKPSSWVIYYKGQVSPPEDGVYRFIGYADDLLAVAVNGKTVCVGARMNFQTWKPAAKPTLKAANGMLTFGDWIPLKKDEPVDLDVLVGERPGGSFCAFLLYEKEGVEYPKTPDGQPMYPVFQLAPAAIPEGPVKSHAPFSLSPTVWRGYQ